MAFGMNGHKDLSQTDNSAFACFQFLYLETTRDALITGAPFRRDSLADYDQVVAWKESLTAEVGDSANVDSYHSGFRETSSFKVTPAAATTFWRVRQMLEREGRLKSVTAPIVPAIVIGAS